MKLAPLAIAGVTILAFVAGAYIFNPKNCLAGCDKKIEVVDASEFKQQVDAGKGVLIDVRTAEEFAAGHLAGAVNIDVNKDFKTEISKLDKNQAYLVYCRSGRRSAEAVKTMEGLGFTKLTDLDGGIVAWGEAKYPIVTETN